MHFDSRRLNESRDDSAFYQIEIIYGDRVDDEWYDDFTEANDRFGILVNDIEDEQIQLRLYAVEEGESETDEPVKELIQSFDNGFYEDEEDEEETHEAPEGFEEFEGHMDDVYQRPTPGKKVITFDGDEYYITDYDGMERSYFWVSEYKRDIDTGRGHSLHKSEVEFISKDVVDEAYRNKETGEVGDIAKELGSDYVLFVGKDGGKSQVERDSLEEVPEDGIEEKVRIVETDSFKKDYANLPNKKEAEWFRSEDDASSANILRYLGFDAAFKAGRVERENISNNNTMKGNAPVYALIKGKGSHNQLRPYFYRDGDKCVFVRCVLKKDTANGPKEYKAIQDTIDHAIANKK